MLVRFLLDVALLITIGALAGATVTQIRVSEPPPPQPTEATTDVSEDPATTTQGEDGSIDSQPVR